MSRHFVQVPGFGNRRPRQVKLPLLMGFSEIFWIGLVKVLEQGETSYLVRNYEVNRQHRLKGLQWYCRTPVYPRSVANIFETGGNHMLRFDSLAKHLQFPVFRTVEQSQPSSSVNTSHWQTVHRHTP